MRSVVFVLSIALVFGCDRSPESPASGQSPTPRSGPAGTGPSSVALCGPQEPGERLTFLGRVLDYQGRPLATAAVMAYHADHQGLYNPKDSKTRVPRIRGVAVTDAEGRFRFSTVRPGTYPDGSEPAHIHVGVMAPAHHVLDLAYWFEGDPLITEERRREASKGPGTVIVKLERQQNGSWSFHHDIRLEGN